LLKLFSFLALAFSEKFTLDFNVVRTNPCIEDMTSSFYLTAA